MEKAHLLYITGLVIIGIICIYVLSVLPHGLPVPELESSFFLFGLGLNTVVFLFAIGGFLLFRWLKTKRQNPTLLVWSISFFVYSVTFIAHIFRALGFSDANENASVAHFFFYRWVMVFFAAGIIYGLLLILTENRKMRLITTGLILALGFSWLILGLFVIPSENPIEFTMYLFLHTVWIPVCFTMSYIFAFYGYKSKQKGPKLVSIGFIGVTVSYFGWAPWHFADVVYLYFIWYFFFLLSLMPILLGFIVMAMEEK